MNSQTLEIIKESECALLGQCLHDGTLFANPFAEISSVVSDEDFLTVDHQLLFRAITTVYESGDPITPVSVAEVLNAQGELNRIGGIIAIYDLQAPVVEGDSAEYYARVIRDAANKRKLLAIGAKIQSLTDDHLSSAEIISQINDQLESVDLSYNKIESITAKELYELDLPPVKWIVPGLIPDGLTVLAGDAKIGKSFFAWNVAISVAMGGTALSNIDIETQRNVTYLALEDPKPLLQERLGLLTSGNIPSNLHIIDNQQNIKFDGFGLKMLDEHIDKTQSQVVIVDTWKHVAPSIDENGTSYDLDYHRMIPIQNFVQSKGISMILITHTRKAADVDNVFNQIQGSMGMQAGCDTMLMLTRGSGGHSLHVTGRRIAQDEYAITLSQDGIWELEGRANDVRKTETRQIIIDTLVDAGDDGMRATDIITSTGRKENAVRLQLRRMLRSGDIIQPSERGKYFCASVQNDDGINL